MCFAVYLLFFVWCFYVLYGTWWGLKELLSLEADEGWINYSLLKGGCAEVGCRPLLTGNSDRVRGSGWIIGKICHKKWWGTGIGSWGGGGVTVPGGVQEAHRNDTKGHGLEQAQADGWTRWSYQSSQHLMILWYCTPNHRAEKWEQTGSGEKCRKSQGKTCLATTHILPLCCTWEPCCSLAAQCRASPWRYRN